jgi:hypothetical protein
MAKTRLPMPLSSVVRRVELVNAGRSPKKLAQAFEPTAQSIKNWVAQPARNIGDGGALPAYITARTKIFGIAWFSSVPAPRGPI